jgi:zinc protease
MRAALVVMAVATFGAAERAASAFDIHLPVQRARLSNGLRVVLAPDDALADVGLIVRYDVGSSDDPNGLEGLAHLVEHLQFSGSRHVARGEHERLLEAAGCDQQGAQTGLDATIYWETVPPEALPLALWLERDRMAFAGDRLDGAVVEREKNIIGLEYRSGLFDREAGLVGTAVANEVFPPWHPYHQPEYAFSTIGAISLRDVRAFLRTWYSPANAEIVVAGHFDPAATTSLIERYFGGLPAAPPPERPALPPLGETRDVVLDLSAGVADKLVMAAWRTPGLGAPGDLELDLAATLLFEHLREKLVRSGLARSVAVRQASARRGSMFVLNVRFEMTASVVPIGDEIQSAIASLQTLAPASEVADARRIWRERRLLTLETSLGRAQTLSDGRSTEDPWGVEDYAQLDAEAVSDAARTYLVPARRVAAVVYPWTRAVPSDVRVVIESRTERR